MGIGVRPICQHKFGNNRKLKIKNNAGIIGQLSVIQHYVYKAKSIYKVYNTYK